MPALRKEKDGSPHIHTYVRADSRYNRKDPNRYKCNHPDCSHTELRHNLKGKRSLCALCFAEGRHTEIILDYENLQLSRPRCQNCAQTKSAKRVRGLATALENELSDFI